MSESYRPAVSGYGAFAMKEAYQRNMMLGTLTMILFVILIIGSAYLISYLIPEPPLAEIPDDVITPPPPPPDGSTQLDNTYKIDRGSRPHPPKPQGETVTPTRPIIVDDTTVTADDDASLASRDEMHDIVNGHFGGNSDGSNINETPGQIYAAAPGDDYPGVYDFVPVDRMPEMIHFATPEYPRLARKAGIEGKVAVRVLLDEEGEPLKAIIENSSGSNAGFDETALEAAMKCRFTPALQNGNPVKIWISFSFDFVLDKNK